MSRKTSKMATHPLSDLTLARFHRLVAEIIAGSAVPRSMGMLGAAAKPWDELHDALDLFGYVTADEVEKAITERTGR